MRPECKMSSRPLQVFHEQIARAVRVGSIEVVVNVGVMRSSALQVKPEPSDDRNDEHDGEVGALLPSTRGENPASITPWPLSEGVISLWLTPIIVRDLCNGRRINL